MASVATVLGDPQHAMNVQHLADEELLDEVAAQDEEHDQGDAGVEGSRRSPVIILKPRAKQRARSQGDAGVEGSGSSGSGPAMPKPRPSKRPWPSQAPEVPEVPEVPEA